MTASPATACQNEGVQMGRPYDTNLHRTKIPPSYRFSVCVHNDVSARIRRRGSCPIPGLLLSSLRKARSVTGLGIR